MYSPDGTMLAVSSQFFLITPRWLAWSEPRRGPHEQCGYLTDAISRHDPRGKPVRVPERDAKRVGLRSGQAAKVADQRRAEQLRDREGELHLRLDAGHRHDTEPAATWPA